LLAVEFLKAAEALLLAEAPRLPEAVSELA
jgi:hypothetical protein